MHRVCSYWRWHTQREQFRLTVFWQFCEGRIMSLLKTIKAQLGLSSTPANNFVLDATADNGTMKLDRGNAGATTQDIMTVDAAGKVSFPIGIGLPPRTWQSFTSPGQRALGTTYTNNTNQDLIVRVRLSLPNVGTALQCTINGQVLLGSTILASAAGADQWTVPPGATYTTKPSGWRVRNCHVV